MQEQLQQYDEIVARHQAAYAAFKAVYTQKTPPPVREQVERDDALVIVALVVMVIASVIVSASHTIPVFTKSIYADIATLTFLQTVVVIVVALAAFAMLEVGIVALAYVLVKDQFKRHPDRHVNVQVYIRAGLVLAFVVAVMANVYSVVGGTLDDEQKGYALWQGFQLLIDVLVGISAPVLAFISGDVLAMQGVAALQQRRAVETRYQVDLATWNENLNASWNAQKARWGVKVDVSVDRLPSNGQTDTPRALSDVSVLSASEQTDRQTVSRAGYGHTRTPDGQAKVIEYLNANPEHASLPSRKLAEMVGVGHDTANKGRNAWQVMQADEGQGA